MKSKHGAMQPFLAAALGLLTLAASPAANNGDPARKPPPGQVTMSKQQQDTVKLQTARAEHRPITEPVRVPGTVDFDESHVAILRPLAQALIVRLLVQPGDAVRPGQPVADLNIPSLAVAEQEQISATAALSEAEAAASVAHDALRRGEILARDGSLARVEVERRRLVLAQAVAAVASVRSRVTSGQAGIDRLNPGKGPGTATISSPIGGVVAGVAVTPGELVDTTSRAFTVADLSVVIVLAQVPEISAALVAVGDSASVRLTAGSNRVWVGSVIALGAALDPQSRTLPARIRLDNADSALRAGMFADVTIISNRNRDGVVIPASAVQTIGNKQVAFTPAGNDRFQSHDLTVGIERSDWVEVRHGLNSGDTVVTQGSFDLKAVLQQSLLDGGG